MRPHSVTLIDVGTGRWSTRSVGWGIVEIDRHGVGPPHLRTGLSDDDGSTYSQQKAGAAADLSHSPADQPARADGSSELSIPRRSRHPNSRRATTGAVPVDLRSHVRAVSTHEPIVFVRYGCAPVAFLLARRVEQRRMRHVDA